MNAQCGGVRRLVLAQAQSALRLLGFDEPELEFEVSINVPDSEQLRFRRRRGEELPSLPDREDNRTNGYSGGGNGGWSIPQRPDGTPPEGLWFSPLEEKIMEELKDGKWLSGEQIAGKIGETYSKELAIILGNLVNRRVLESKAGRGYRLYAGDVANNAGN